MLSRRAVHYFATAPRSFESIHVSTSRAFHSPRPNMGISTNTQRPISSQEQSNHSDSAPLANDVSQRRPRQSRQAMTARESNAFNEMFAMIFDAAAAQEKSLLSSDSVIGVGTNGIDDLIGKLRKYPKRLKWSTELDDVLDRQKEIINLFTTDQELLEWTTDAIFGESQKYEAAARKAISEAASSGVKGELPMLQPPTYPHLVAFIMQTFREKFNDPHLALSIFEHARNLSIASYVFGCSSQAYHQLIETRWKCFQDLTGVLEALQEMQLNGVKVSGLTRRLVEKLRREIAEKHLWAEESEVGSGEVLNILTQIEKLALSDRGALLHGNHKATGSSRDVKWDEWKTRDPNEEGVDGWDFDQWSARPPRSYGQDSDAIETGGTVPSRRPEFKGGRGFEDESFGGTWSSQPIDISEGDEWDFNQDKLIDLKGRDTRETAFDGGRTFVTQRSASKPSDSMDDWSFGDEEFPSDLWPSSETVTSGNRDEQRPSWDELGNGDIRSNAESRWSRSTGSSRTRSSRTGFGLKPKDDGSLEDGKSTGQGSQDGDAQDRLSENEPKSRGRTLKRRRFGLRADVPEQS